MAFSPIEYGTAQPDEYRQSLELVLRSLLPSARGPLVESLGRVDPEPLGPFDALVVARSAGNVIGAAWAQPHVGKTASLWMPAIEQHHEQNDEIRVELLKSINRVIDLSGVTMVQALLENSQDPIRPLIIEADYHNLAELSYLALQGDSLETGESASTIEFEPYTTSNHLRFKQTIEATYEGSLDCPEMEGRRDQEDVLAGYQAIGTSQANHWYLATSYGQELGALLLAEHEDGQFELVYMGLCPEARGQGHGDKLVAKAKHIAQEGSADRLIVAVDARNQPAQKVYARHGFTPWATRHVFVRWKGGDI